LSTKYTPPHHAWKIKFYNDNQIHMPPVSPSQPPTHIEFQMLIKFVVTPLFKIWDNIKLRKVKE